MKVRFKTYVYKFLAAYFILCGCFMVGGCTRSSHKIKTVKPIARHRYYNPKKDRYRKRTRTVTKRYN